MKTGKNEELTRGIRNAWQILRDANHKIHDPTGFQKVLKRWHKAFEGIKNAPQTMKLAAEQYVEHFRQLMKEHGPTSEGANRLGYKPFPKTATFALFLPERAKRAPPTEQDIADLKWWPPTGSTATAKDWVIRSHAARRIKPHLNAGCFWAWKPDTRITHLFAVSHMGWVEEWPNPASYDPEDRNWPVRRTCGLHCNLGNEPVAHFRDDEKAVIDKVAEWKKMNIPDDAYLSLLVLEQHEWNQAR